MALPEQVILDDIVYVCSTSGYNLPEYEACLLRRPRYLVLIVSNYGEIQQAAERFSRVVRQALPGIEILRPDVRQVFDGADLQAYQIWQREQLLPTLQALPESLPRICNLTGGTKIMALALSRLTDWAWIEYKADRTQELQKFSFGSDGFVDMSKEVLPQADPFAVAELYSEHVRRLKPNQVVEHRQSICQANRLWNGLTTRDAALLQLFGSECSGLEMVWMYGKDQEAYQQQWLELSCQAFIGQAFFTTEQLGWLNAWASLSETGLQVDAQKLRLAGNRKNMRESLRRWLSGDWLEQLAAHWLEQVIPAEHITMNVRVRPDNADNSSTGERETDILIHHQGRTSIVEVKTDLPPGGDFATGIRQLASISDRFGRSNKVLLIGPQLYQRCQARMDVEILRCQAEGILLAYDKVSLLHSVIQGRQFEAED